MAQINSGGLTLLAAMTGAGLAVGYIVGNAQPGTDEHKITIVYDVKEGVGLQLDKGIQAQKVPCYPGDPVGRCFLISAKPLEVEPTAVDDPDADIPESSDE
jgi:hypothetical protein